MTGNLILTMGTERNQVLSLESDVEWQAGASENTNTRMLVVAPWCVRSEEHWAWEATLPIEHAQGDSQSRWERKVTNGQVRRLLPHC